MKNSIIYLFAAIVLIGSSCTKKGSVKPTNNNTDSIIIKNNVFVIDSTKLTLISTPVQLSNGTYIFTTNSTFPDFVQNGIIVGSTEQGYLRKIISITTQSGQVILNTSQACLEDVFQQGTFSMGSDFSALQRSSHRTTDNGYQFPLNNITLYQNGPLTITLTSGNITINPNWNINYDFQNGSLSTFSALCQNGSLNANMQINVLASQSINVSQSDTIKEASSTTIKFIGTIPVVITTDLYLIMNISGTLSASINKTFTINNIDSFNFGSTYSGGAWQNVYSFTPTTTLNSTPDSGNVGLTITCSLVPQMNIVLYGIVGPYASIPLNEYIVANLASPALDWDYTAGAFLQPTIGVAASILGHSLGDYNHSWYSDSIVYKTPYQINKISGDNQIGPFGQPLPLPLKVQVLDNNGSPQSKVPVYFTIAAGGGSALPTSILTDANGYAQTQWTVGSAGTQMAQANARMANGTSISAPVIFNSTNTPDSTYYVRCVIDGVPFSVYTANITDTNSGSYFYMVATNSSNDYVELQINGFTGATGTYACNNSTIYTIYYDHNDTHYYYIPTDMYGTTATVSSNSEITISQITATAINGTFQFIVATQNPPPAAQSVTVTGGVFSIPRR